MKMIVLIVTLTAGIVFRGDCFAGEGTTNEWGSVTCGAQLSLRLQESHEAITPTNSLIVNVELRNVSDKIITFRQSVPSALNYTFVAISPKGAEMKSKLPDRRTIEWQAVSYTQVKPGENLAARINLFDVYDLKEVGTYKVTLKCRISVPDGKDGKEYCDLPSNELKLTIPPPK